jgi:predicted transcriptional regulator
MRYDGSRKLTRNLALVEYKDANPSLAWSEIAPKFNITRQRAAQIYRAMKRRVETYQE